jgi:salicylate hydroxylase
VPEVAVVDPAPFLMEMLNGTSEKRLHPNMTLVDISPQSDDGPIDLTFQDGTKLTADVLIGDDGPVGLMRSYVLGREHEATYPVFMNILSAVGHVPPKDARKLLGSPYGEIESQRRYERVGDGAFLLSAYLDGFFTTLGSFYSEEDYDLSQFTRATTPKELEHYFGNFAGGNGIVEVSSVSKPSPSCASWLIRGPSFRH